MWGDTISPGLKDDLFLTENTTVRVATVTRDDADSYTAQNAALSFDTHFGNASIDLTIDIIASTDTSSGSDTINNTIVTESAITNRAQLAAAAGLPVSFNLSDQFSDQLLEDPLIIHGYTSLTA